MLINNRDITDILLNYKTIAVVGLSPKNNRPSNQVARYLLGAGYVVIPVNPGQNEILGLTSYPDLRSIPLPVEVVNIFRRARDIPPIAAEAVEIGAKAVWMQLGIINEAAARTARAAGLTVIMDRCIMADHKNLGLLAGD